CFAYMVPALIVSALIGMIAGGIAINEIRKYGHLGQPYAMFGFLTSLLIAMTALPVQVALFYLELPADHVRVDFAEFTKARNSGLDKYLGRKIYLKGYAYPQRNLEIDRFVLTATGNPNDFEAMIVVEMPEGETWRYDGDGLAVAGELE